MATTLETLKRIAPFVETLTDSELNEYILLAQSQVSSGCASLIKYQLIISNLVAHMITLAHVLEDDQASPVIGKRSGKESISFATTVGQEGHGLTKYGQEYMRLIKTLACTKPLTSHWAFYR